VDNTNRHTVSATVPSRSRSGRSPGLGRAAWFALVGAQMNFVRDSLQVTG